ncbi:MAG: hypothetical protein EBY74_04295 [Actinobacteria bacterium]|nr:hypothetical protein [Actinomycetota bacterium]
MFKKILTLVLTFVTLLAFATPSYSEETGYRYWGYFQAAPSQSTWTMAMTGPTTNVADGSVEGWIHTFSSDSINAMAPRLAPNFFTLCSKVRPVACVQIESKATGAEILAAATKIRAGSSGFICGINGFPAKECSAEIKTPRILMKKS